MTYSFIDCLKNTELDALKAELVDTIDSLNNSDFVALYNEYAENNNYEKLYENEEYTINVLFGEDCNAWIVMSSLEDGYTTNHAYCIFNGRRLLESGNDPRELAYIDTETLANFVSDYAEDYEISDIAEVMEKYEEIGEKHWNDERESKMELTDFENENLRDAINVRLTDILNDEELMEIVSPKTIRTSVKLLEKLGYTDWSEDFKKEFADWVDFE